MESEYRPVIDFWFRELTPQQWSSAAPGLAIASMRHETQYSRLFRS